MKLLTIDEVTELWDCRRITVLRLMKNHTLRWRAAKDGEPLFDLAEVLCMRHTRIWATR